MDRNIAKKLLEKNRTDYNLIADQFSSTRKFNWQEFEGFMKYVNSGDNILDAGCGNGRLSELLSKKDINYTGMDKSDNLIKIAKEKYPNYKFITGDITNLPFSDNEFNIIFCIATLHHIPGIELRQKAINEFNHILKPGGYLIMTNWNLLQKKWWSVLSKNNFKKLIRQNNLDFRDVMKPWKDTRGIEVTQRYIHAITKKELSKLLKKNGFKVVKQYYTNKGNMASWITGYNLATITKKS